MTRRIAPATEVRVAVDLSTAESFPAKAAVRGGDLAPSGPGRAQHDWTDWVPVAASGVDEALSERVCVACGEEQIVPADSLVSVAVLRPRKPSIRGEAA
jgi:hypothetical protein